VLFLAPDEARYITGVTLPVDAGGVIKRFLHLNAGHGET
jgi:NAD(P)-dependent dehydrogenase (short-subunit alcohol dehydrogenase family)